MGKFGKISMQPAKSMQIHAHTKKIDLERRKSKLLKSKNFREKS